MLFGSAGTASLIVSVSSSIVFVRTAVLGADCFCDRPICVVIVFL